jgi:general secretion pathway protein F
VKSLVLQVRNDVVSGHSLGVSLKEFPRAFDDMYCAMVRAGESAGFLGEVLEQLADYIENRQFTRQKLKMAMIYPLTLMVVAMVVISLLMIFVMPELVSLFVHTDTALPFLTRSLIGVSEVVARFWWLLLLVVISVSVLLRYILGLPGPRAAWDRFVLRLPFISPFMKNIDTERFASTLSILVSSGVPLLDGLRIAGAVMSNVHMQQACRKVAVAVQEGESLHQAMTAARVFPPMLVQMVASGESSGNLETMLTRSAKNQGRELEATLNSVLGIMEPLIIVVMATVVGTIVMAVLLPIMQMNTLVA